jgi:hypothetical protein
LVAAKQLQEGILNSLDLAFHREQVDAVNPSKKNLLADIELGVVLALSHEQVALAVADQRERQRRQKSVGCYVKDRERFDDPFFGKAKASCFERGFDDPRDRRRNVSFLSFGRIDALQNSDKVIGC